MNWIRLVAGGALLVTTGCATVPRDAGFPEVEKTVAERTGKRVHWNQGSPVDAEVAAQVKEMLSKELTSEEAVQIALLNNRSLQATYETLSVAQADLVAAGLLQNPVFDAEVRFVEGGGGTGFEVAVVQEFIDILYIPLRKRLAESSFEAAKLSVAGRVIDLAGEVRVAFYSLQAAQQSLEMRRQVLTSTEASYDLAKRLRAAGNNTELDVANERALYEQAKLDVRTAELQVLRGRERLNTLMGLWGEETQWTIATRLPDIPQDEVAAEDLERRAIEQSIDLSVSRKELERSATSVGIARPLGLFSELELGATAEREPEGEWSGGPTFALPLPLFNQGQPAVAAARAEFRRARELYAAQAVALRSQVRTAHAAVIAARERAAYYVKVVLPLRQQIVEQTQLQYNAMQIGAFQLLEAKEQQIEAANAYISALRDYWVARTDLDQLLAGRMTSFGEPVGDDESPSQASAGSGRGGH
jgi:outer membrane protein, heavy metal efflux system